MEMSGMRTSTSAGGLAQVLGQVARRGAHAREARLLSGVRAGGRAPSSAGS